MSSYQGSTSVRADVHAIFEFVTNPEKLSLYVPCIQQADHGHGDVIHIKGECPHGPFRGVGGFSVDAENFRMRWDSRANLNYRGWLQLADHGDETAVLIHLEFDPGMDRSANEEFSHLLKEHPNTIQGAIDEALSRIKHICENALTPA